MNSLYEKTLKLLEASEQSLQEIATGSGLPYHWLVGIKYERFKDPSVNRIQRLYEYLAGTNLPV